MGNTEFSFDTNQTSTVLIEFTLQMEIAMHGLKNKQSNIVYSQNYDIWYLA